jgi:hypothetical protein
MKFALVVFVTTLCVSVAGPPVAAAQELSRLVLEDVQGGSTDMDSPAWKAALPKGVAFFTGYKSALVKQSFAHDTHPDDGFLPNADVPGSAGTTSLNRAQYLELGLRYEMPAAGRWSFDVNVAGLLAYTSGHGADASGWNLDDSQNANDSRSPDNAAFVYTNSPYGFDVALGATCGLSRVLYLGAVADLAGLVAENGWDRFSSFQVQSRKLMLVPAGGPRLGLRFTRDIGIEGRALFAKKGTGYDGGLVIRF